MNGTSLTPEYGFIFDFERRFDPGLRHQWILDNFHWSFYIAAVYVIGVFGGQSIMSDRPAFRLRGAMTAWNIGMAAFSLLGAARTVPELVYSLNNFGFQHSICNPSYFAVDKVSGFWTWMYILSKIPELGDTIFIVLRKQKLVFLHWYHHVSVLLFTWYAYREYSAMGRWFICMNYSVHAIMYTYFALRSLKISVPRPIAMFITMSQVLQMVIGAYVSVMGYRAWYRHLQPCDVTEGIAKVAPLVYGVYFIIFVKLFYESYLAPRKNSKHIKLG